MAEEAATEAIEETNDAQTEDVSPDVAKWKAEARKWEKRSKENASAVEELAKLKESQLTEVEKATKRADAAERELETYKAAAQRAEWNASVAKSTGLPLAAIELLAAESEEELVDKANELKGQIEPKDESKNTVPVVLGAGQNPKTPEKTGGDWVREAISKR